MTVMEQVRRSVGTDQESRGRAEQRGGTNVGSGERMVSVAAGGILTLLGLGRRSVPGLMVGAVGGAMVLRGVTGQCGVYRALGIDTAEPDEGAPERTWEALESRGVEVKTAFLISKPAEELYRFWRNFENLPGFMSYLESVRVVDDRKSHWVAKAPRMAGGSVEWDAEITDDEPGRRIAWRSLPGSQVDNAGEIRFEKGMGDRGTEVHVSLSYLPPAGRVGHWMAKMFGESADTQVREGLRNFKRLMETGEIPTIAGQPRGTCLGRGMRTPA